ncbi:MAG: NAD(P)H-dependent oxidoreductase [Succinivibrio sp.]|jgi:putative NADPH-quinone reductase|nr:NAD(P)H-dependent oxidoreductase [Succinivibrio sp.]
MKKTVIFVDHPHFDRSVVNRRWTEELRKYPDEFVIHNLESAYPRGVIDPSLEHSLIENNGVLVLQFPVYWYNCPPMLKQWMDVALTLDWAYGKAHKLEGRKIALAVTCGGSQSDYAPDGRDPKAELESILKPFIRSIAYLKAEYAGLYVFFGAASKEDATVEKIAESARGYVDFLRNIAGMPAPEAQEKDK